MRVTIVDSVVVLAVSGGGPRLIGPPDPLAEWVNEEMSPLLEEGRRAFVLDISNTHEEFLDSARIAPFVCAYKKVQAHEGELRVVLSPKQSEMWNLVNLQEVIPFYETVPDALRSLGIQSK